MNCQHRLFTLWLHGAIIFPIINLPFIYFRQPTCAAPTQSTHASVCLTVFLRSRLHRPGLGEGGFSSLGSVHNFFNPLFSLPPYSPQLALVRSVVLPFSPSCSPWDQSPLSDDWLPAAVCSDTQCSTRTTSASIRCSGISCRRLVGGEFFSATYGLRLCHCSAWLSRSETALTYFYLMPLVHC